MWHKKAQENYDSSQPSAAAPLAKLLDYMQNPANPSKDRWTTFSYYVQGGATTDEQALIISGMLSMSNPAEDAALKN
jgi:hypothetical protein